MAILKGLISWLHIAAAALSLVVGTIVLLKGKGNKDHVQLGTWYFYLMIANNASALLIYNAFGRWFFPHALAVVGLVVCFAGYLAIRKGLLKLHIFSFVVSYYLLIGGAINEAFIRIEGLRAYQAVYGMLHSGTILFFVGLLIYYLVRYRRLKVRQGLHKHA